MRTMWAFAAAPFPAALFQSVVVALWPKEGMGVFENPASMFVAVCLYFCCFGLVLGIPAWLVMRKCNVADLRSHLLAGLAVGLLPAGTALGWMVIQAGAPAYVIAYNLLFFGLGGITAGWLFWTIARRSGAKMEQAQPVG